MNGIIEKPREPRADKVPQAVLRGLYHKTANLVQWELGTIPLNKPAVNTISKNLKKGVDIWKRTRYNIWALERELESLKRTRWSGLTVNEPVRKTWKKCLTNKTECGKIVKRSREKPKGWTKSRVRGPWKLNNVTKEGPVISESLNSKNYRKRNLKIRILRS